MTSLFVGIFALLPLGACSLLPIQDVGSNFMLVIFLSLSIRFFTPDSNTFFPCLDYQWPIQNFPDRGGGVCSILRLGENLLFGMIFAEHCMRIKEIEPREGDVPPNWGYYAWRGREGVLQGEGAKGGWGVGGYQPQTGYFCTSP